MKNSDAIRILDALAAGKNPLNGTTAVALIDLAHPDVVRALILGSQALEQLEPAKPGRIVKTLPAAAGMTWDAKEDERLRQEFKDKQIIANIAKAHGRSTGAISARLVKLGLVQMV